MTYNFDDPQTRMVVLAEHYPRYPRTYDNPHPDPYCGPCGEDWKCSVILQLEMWQENQKGPS